jgi:hypothetical protein
MPTALFLDGVVATRDDGFHQPFHDGTGAGGRCSARGGTAADHLQVLDAETSGSGPSLIRKSRFRPCIRLAQGARLVASRESVAAAAAYVDGDARPAPSADRGTRPTRARLAYRR